MPLMSMGLKEEHHDGDWADWEAWARNELMSTGSELHGKFLNLQVLLHPSTSIHCCLLSFSTVLS